MDERKVRKIIEQYQKGELDLGEASIELMAAGVPAKDILKMLGENPDSEE